MRLVLILAAFLAASPAVAVDVCESQGIIPFASTFSEPAVNYPPETEYVCGPVVDNRMFCDHVIVPRKSIMPMVTYQCTRDDGSQYEIQEPYSFSPLTFQND